MQNMIDVTLEIGYIDARDARSNVPARISLDARGLTLLVDEGSDAVLWHGERLGQGHYVLRAKEPGVEATLHRFADSAILEGFWRSGAQRGFWRLHLPADAVIPTAIPAAPPTAQALESRPKAARKRIRRVA